jgi:Uncharacterized protein SCO1/SenC/PrrC, involved in biogenesis of respiratory and photosynthetic systems
MSTIRRSTWASLIVILFGVLLFAVSTDGFRAYTAEAARTIKLNSEHPAFPNVTLQDSTGQTFQMSELSGKLVLLTFVYTSCGTVCPQIEMNFTEIFNRLPREMTENDVVFLSVSFDPDRDTPEALETYRHHFSHDPNWRMVRVPDKSELDLLLQTFGVIVIPGENGDFAHNGAFYLIDRQGKLAEIIDYKKVGLAIDKIKHQVGKGVAP